MPDHILGHSAVELFIVRMSALGVDVSPRAEELASVAAICRRLDGIPLAIEFAAARAATLGIASVAAGLRDRFALLTSGRRTALPRHRTLRAVLDWSYELLPEAEQRLLRHLAIFSGGFTVEAAAAVVSDGQPATAASVMRASPTSSPSPWSRWTVTRLRVGICWKRRVSMRSKSSRTAARPGRRRGGTRRSVWRCSRRSEPQGSFRPPSMNFERYRTEVDNLRAALNWAFSDEGDAALGVALAATAADFWAAASLLPEACEWAGKALARIGDAAGTRHEMVLQCSFGIARLLTKGMNDEAHEALTQALALAREFADFDYRQRATHGLWLFLYPRHRPSMTRSPWHANLRRIPALAIRNRGRWSIAGSA